ncbi:hypothetical protein RB195_001118 [Necator americanus]|uniref:SET domain protein n=1 Tax=Necator americanus TaxID=51031 RepID=A0ABR1DD98_NECAM
MDDVGNDVSTYEGYRAKHYTADYKKIGMNFEYVATNVPGPNTDTGAWELLACCDCTSECSAEQKCTCLLGAEDNYSINGLFLEKSSGAPILECHRECSCSTWDKPCRNRVVQRGVNVLLEVYKCSDEKGFGVRAAEPIPEQTFICEYAGEVLDKEEVEERAMFKHDHNYTLTVQEHGAGGVITTFIDPRRRGNLARFINHGCQPNLSMAILVTGKREYEQYSELCP